MPGTFANSVSSLPRPTLSPGKNFVPRWRTRREPPVTSWPPNRLTPRRCELESRPLREEPCPFLCAMDSPGGSGDRKGPRLLCSFDPVDTHLEHRLTVAPGAPVLLAPLFLEHEDFLRAHGANDGGLDRDSRPASGVLALVAADEQDVGERQRLSPGDLVGRRLDPDDVAGRDLQLFPARAENGVHETSRGRTANHMGLRAKVKPGIG